MQKIIHAVEFKNLYENSIEKKPEIIDTIENNYRIIRWVCQHLYADIANMFFEYIYSLDPHEIQQLDGDIKTNGYCVINLLEIDNALELLSTFQLFYHNNGIWPVTNGLLIVPDREVQEGQEKINLKNLYEIFRYTKSHGLVSMQFKGALGISELCKSHSYSNFNFDAIFDLVSKLRFFHKKIYPSK